MANLTVNSIPPLPETGRSVLTVRESRAPRIRGIAKAKGMTVDHVVNDLPDDLSGPSRSTTGQWSVCEKCGSKVKTKNLEDHGEGLRDSLTVNSQA